tara:strand:- start:35 stop:424 length:390 start_codon:yes stop_codon:yes gene_type:complete
MKESITPKKLREFGILISIVFPLLIGWLFPLITGHSFRAWTIFISIPSLILGIFKPVFLLFPYKVWMKTGDILGWINSRIILGAFFFFMLFPIAIIMRILKYDPLRTRKGNQDTYKELKSTVSNLKNIF